MSNRFWQGVWILAACISLLVFQMAAVATMDFPWVFRWGMVFMMVAVMAIIAVVAVTLYALWKEERR